MRSGVGILALGIALGCRGEPPTDHDRLTKSGTIALGPQIDLTARPTAVGFVARNGVFEANGAAYVARAERGLSIAAFGRSAVLKTTVSRGVRALLASDVPGSARTEGVLERVAEETREEIEPRARELEQRWRFPVAPRGTGDVVVRVALDGARGEGDATGIALRTPAGPLLHYGHGTWIDASGARVAIRAAIRDGAIELRVPDVLVRSSTYPAVLDPTLSIEAGVDTATVSGVPVAVRGAFGGGVYLLAYIDGTDIRVKRFSATGALLDPTGVRIGASAYPFAIAFDGTQFAVLRGSTANIVSVAGVVGPDIVLDGSGFYGDLTAASGWFVAAWGALGPATTPSPTQQVWWKRFKADGTKDTLRTRYGVGPVALGSNGTTSYLGFKGWYFYNVPPTPAMFIQELQYVTINADGTITATPNPAAAGDQPGPIVWSAGASKYFCPATPAFCGGWPLTFPLPVVSAGPDGSGWLVHLFDATTSAPRAVHMTATGTLVESTPLPIATYLGGQAGGDSTNVGFSDGTWFHLVRRSDLVTVSHTALVPSANTQSSARIATSDTGVSLVTWADDRYPSGVYGVRFDATGKAIDMAARAIVPGAAHATAWGSGSHWILGRGTLAKMAADGTISTLTTASRMVAGELVHDGTQLLALEAKTAPTFVRIRADGTTFGGGTLTGAESVGLLPLSGGSVLAAQSSLVGSSRDVSHRTINADDTLGSLTAFGSLTTADERAPVVARALGGVFAAFVATSGTTSTVKLTRILDGAWTAPIDIASGSVHDVRIAGDAKGAFVAWIDDAAGLRIVRVSGTVLGVSATASVTTVAPKELRLSSIAAQRALVVYRLDKQLLARAVTFGADNGTSCAAAGECESGFCVDGVCCASACTGQCEACDLVGAEGSCRPWKGSPRGTRPACSGIAPGTECGSQCLGTDSARASCGFPTSAIACSKDECAAGTETHASTCDGAGRCSDVPRSCGGFACIGAVCRTSCTATSDCLGGHYCKDNACTPLAALGTTCTSTAHCAAGTFCIEGVCCVSDGCGAGKTCASRTKPGRCALAAGQSCTSADACGDGFCVDGVCCESACEQQCAACDLPGSLGKCIASPGRPHGTRPPCVIDATNPCASKFCDGVDTAMCGAFAAKDTVCRARSCSAGSLREESRCDGAGACIDGTTASCGGLVCAEDAKSCRTSCTSTSDCVAGFVCTDGKCLPVASRCSEDRASAVSTSDGALRACSPFLCDPAAGTCRSQCVSESDCAVGFVCTAAGECAAPSEPPQDDGGCSTSNARSPDGRWLALVLVAIACLTRRVARGELRFTGGSR